MPEDFSVGSWENEVSPEQMLSFSEAKLRWVQKASGGRHYDVWAGAELARRRDEHLSELIKSLSSSSDRLERLTKTLRNLTWVLIVLTFLAVLVPAGLDFWKAYHPLIIFKP